MVTMAGAVGPVPRRIGRLAPEFTSFVGRRHELRQIRRLVSASRLVTITGTAGVGKTRLATRVASQMYRVYTDGVWQVDLAGLQDASLLEYALAEAWGIGGVANVPTSQLLAEYVADRQLLLLLDNCEHMLDDCAVLAASLLRAGPGLRVLCTTRQPLGVVGETVYEVLPLSVPPPGIPPAGADGAAHAALTLFVERAEAAVAGFTLMATDRSTVVEICQRLDGLPLAIELAAAQLRTLSVGQVAAGLVDRFRLLAVRRAMPEHHRTLLDTFDWSFALCSSAEQALWNRLAVFSDSFDLAAAAAVCTDDDLPVASILGVLAGLIDKSIVQRDASVEPVRYRMLDSVREYVRNRQRGAGDLWTTLCRRHAAWYLHVAERFDGAWFGPDQPRLCRAIRADLDNVRAALGWCLATPGQTQNALRLAAALRFYWTGGGGLSEGRHWLARTLAADPAPTGARAAACSAYTRVLITQADWTGAAASAAECLALVGRLDDPLLTAGATVDLGMYLFMAGEDLPRAQVLLEDAVARYGHIDHHDYGSVTMAQLTLALTALYRGDRKRAEQLCADRRAFSRAHRDHWHRSHVLVASALVALANQDPAQAVGYLRECLPIHSELGNTVGIAQAIGLMSRAVAANGEYAFSAGLAGAAQRIWRGLGGTGSGARLFGTWITEVTEQARRTLGESAYQAEYQRGWGLSLDGAIAYALGAEPAPAPHPADAPRTGSPLTRREQQVAELIAEGLSNKQIAARLVVSQRTAESHVENVLRKLGFISRTQVATWILQHRE
jgi:predicted ATPase/DNA-binding CsgD family transcriptional regulator